MSGKDKILYKVLTGASDADIRFDDLCALLQYLGFTERIRGSHHIFTRETVIERINLQKDGAKAKSYQVRQVRMAITKNKLGGTHGKI